MNDTTLALAGFAVTILLAGGGWVFTHLNKRSHDARAAQLDRVNRQLRDLYGPLYVGLAAGTKTWEAFWQAHRPAHGEEYYFGPNVEVTDEERATWRLWVTHVFEPMNAEAEAIISNHIDLLDEEEIPEPLIDALAHIAAYRATLAQWEAGDFSQHASVNNWPRDELMAIVKPAYERLRRRQRQLLQRS